MYVILTDAQSDNHPRYVAVHFVKLALHDFSEYGIKGEWTLLSN